MKTFNHQSSPQEALGLAVTDASASAARRRNPGRDTPPEVTGRHRSGYVAAGCAALFMGCAMSANAAETVVSRSGPIVERHIAADMRPGSFGDAQRIFPAKVDGDAWTTGADIDAAQSALDAIRQRDGSIPTQGVRAFGTAKAQCWIDLAHHGYREVALNGLTETSVAVARRQIEALEANSTVAELDTPETRRGTDTAFAGLPQVAGVREDLWQRLAGYRTPKALRCVPKLVPCMETDLVEAGYEVAANLRPVSHAEDALGRAMDRMSKIDEGLAACSEPMVAAPPPPQPVPAPSTRRFTLSGETLFRFDGSNEAALLPYGRAEIDKIVWKLRNDYTHIDRLEVNGYTDRLGSTAYNARLSQRRAQTVANMLRKLGVNAGAVSVRGLGERDPVTTDCKGTIATKALRECLQPDRRVVLDVSGETRQ